MQNKKALVRPPRHTLFAATFKMKKLYNQPNISGIYHYTRKIVRVYLHGSYVTECIIVNNDPRTL